MTRTRCPSGFLVDDLEDAIEYILEANRLGILRPMYVVASAATLDGKFAWLLSDPVSGGKAGDGEILIRVDSSKEDIDEGLRVLRAMASGQ